MRSRTLGEWQEGVLTVTSRKTAWLQRFRSVKGVPQGSRVHATMDEIWMKSPCWHSTARPSLCTHVHARSRAVELHLCAGYHIHGNRCGSGRRFVGVFIRRGGTRGTPASPRSIAARLDRGSPQCSRYVTRRASTLIGVPPAGQASFKQPLLRCNIASRRTYHGLPMAANGSWYVSIR